MFLVYPNTNDYEAKRADKPANRAAQVPRELLFADSHGASTKFESRTSNQYARGQLVVNYLCMCHEDTRTNNGKIYYLGGNLVRMAGCMANLAIPHLSHRTNARNTFNDLRPDIDRPRELLVPDMPTLGYLK